MTLLNERLIAVKNARQFLLDLLSPKMTPKVPKSVRLRASRLLKHFPNEFDMERSILDPKKFFKSDNKISTLRPPRKKSEKL